MVSCTLAITSPIFMFFAAAMKRELITIESTVYEVSSGMVYWMSYFHQMIGLSNIFVFGVAYDAFVAGCMLQLCAQIEIMNYNIGNISFLEEYLQYSAIVRCVHHHNSILRQTSLH